jgi:hypothetical protein
MPFDGAVFGGPARSESRNYWLKREKAEEVLIPDVEKFGEKDKVTGVQNWEELPAGYAIQGLLLPTPPGKEYRLLKVVTVAASPAEVARLGNDRVPALVPDLKWCWTGDDEYPPEGLPVWATDREVLRKTKWTFAGAGVPLSEGKWEDANGRPFAAAAWLPIEEHPEPPPLPRR